MCGISTEVTLMWRTMGLYSHNKFLEHKETRRVLNTSDKTEQAWLRQHGVIWYTDRSVRPCTEVCRVKDTATLMLSSVSGVLQLLNWQLLNFAYSILSQYQQEWSVGLSISKRESSLNILYNIARLIFFCSTPPTVPIFTFTLCVNQTLVMSLAVKIHFKRQ